MPIYEYRCPDCGNRFEKLVPMSTRSKDLECPRCGRPEPERLMSTIAAVGSSADGVACAPRGRFT